MFSKEMSTSTEQAEFRLNCIKFLVTYPHYQANKQALHQHIEARLQRTAQVRIAHETHEDGTFHTHAAVLLNKKCDTRDPRILDIEGHHPNITKPMDIKHWRNQINYMNKEDPEPYGELTVEPSKEERFQDAVEYVLSCQRLKDIYRPGDHLQLISGKVHFFENLWKNQARKKTAEARHSAFNRPFITDWSRSWLIYGASQTGKTQYALAHFKKPLLVRHIDKLKEFDSDTHDGIVFDDMGFNHLHAQAIIHLLDTDNDSQIHCRFNVAEIPEGTKKIFVSNRDDIFTPKDPINEEEKTAIERRYYTIHVFAKLF